MSRTSIYSIHRTNSQVQMLRQSAPTGIAVKIDYYLLTGRWPKGPSIFVFPRLCWERAMSWTPGRWTTEFIWDMCALFITVSENCLYTAAALLLIYVAIEVGSAFLPGGPVSRVLGGLQ